MTREDAKREIMFAKRNVVADSWIDQAYDVAIKALSEPEIIRCRDCRYWYRMTINIGKCERVFNANCGIWDSDDYCSYAERPEVSE